MDTRRVVLHGQTRKKRQRVARKCRDVDARVRYLIVLRTADGRGGKRIARALGCGPSTVGRMLAPPVETARRYAGVALGVTTMGRPRRRMNVRRGRARPTST